ncbi:DNA 3'-5' helicase [Entamoeba marina]
MRGKRNNHNEDSLSDSEDDLEDGGYETNMRLKPNHKELPIWITTDSKIFVETSNSLLEEVTKFLNRVAESSSRLQHIHEYKITDNSLMGAFSFGMTPNELINKLDQYSKNYLPNNVCSWIKQVDDKNENYRLILSNGRYYLQGESEKQMRNVFDEKTKHFYEGVFKEVTQGSELYKELGLDHSVYIIEVKSNYVTKLKKVCKYKRRNIRIYEEYHFLKDKTKELPGELKSDNLRLHQNIALQHMFNNEIARSGIIILPCGSGKTLTAIAACLKIKRSTIIISNSTQSARQWKEEFRKWSTVNPLMQLKYIHQKKKDQLGDDACILLTTYSMLAFDGPRQYSGELIMKDLLKREWGMIIYDEVQSAPTEKNVKVCSQIKVQCKLGLTATLVREDEKIGRLEFLIGPKLYEASWQDLTDQGFIAKPRCFEIICPMSTVFYNAYLSANETKTKKYLEIINPRKVEACKFLVDAHLSRGDKVIVFCDKLAPARYYAKQLECSDSFMEGGTSDEKRAKILESFRNNETNLILFTRVGDTSIDLPDASVAIQLSANGSSRRQEAQRLGRILRIKKDVPSGRAPAYFYSLTSQDTKEIYFSQKRQRFLLDKGYEYKLMPLQDIKTLHHENEKKDTKLINMFKDAGIKEDQQKKKERCKKK